MKSKLRVGIIGAGAVVREIYQHLFFRSQYSALIDVVAVADPNEECRNWFGDLAGLSPQARYSDYLSLLKEVELDAVQVNTPDHLHCDPAIAALEAGLDVVVPKPTAATLQDAHQMIVTARRTGRFLGIDFHKREDPRIKEAEARYQSGRYGSLQMAVFYMLDKLLVADPNHVPRFFASPDFAEKNTPASFLTVHMADALMKIANLIPVEVKATGFGQKLASLRPISVRGYDLISTEILFANGSLAHIITGWALPNSAWALTVQSARLICTDGLVDLSLDTPGLKEVHAAGIIEVNPLFKNFERDGSVTGYGISSPGRLYQQILAHQNNQLSPEALAAATSPMALGFYTTLVLQAAELSLQRGVRSDSGVTRGESVSLKKMAEAAIGEVAVRDYGLC